MKIVVEQDDKMLCSFEEEETFETIHDLTRALMEAEYVHFVYEDDEGDSVTVSSHDELAEGLRVAREERRDTLVLNVTPEVPGGTGELSRTSSNSSFVLIDDFGVEMSPMSGDEAKRTVVADASVAAAAVAAAAAEEEELVAAVAQLALPELVDVVEQENPVPQPPDYPPPPLGVEVDDREADDMKLSEILDLALNGVEYVPVPAENPITNPEKEGYVPLESLDAVLGLRSSASLGDVGRHVSLSPVSDADDEVDDECEFESEEPSASAPPDYVSEEPSAARAPIPVADEPNANTVEESVVVSSKSKKERRRTDKKMRHAAAKQARKLRKRAKSATKKALKAAKRDAHAAKLRAKDIERERRLALASLYQSTSCDQRERDPESERERLELEREHERRAHERERKRFDYEREREHKRERRARERERNLVERDLERERDLVERAERERERELAERDLERERAEREREWYSSRRFGEREEAKRTESEQAEGGAARDTLSTIELKALYADFLADPRVQEEMPKATQIAFKDLEAGRPLSSVLDNVFAQCMAIADHTLIARVRADLPRVVHRVEGWVPTLVSLGESTLQLAVPHILSALPRLFDGGRDLDVNLDHLLDVYMANPDARNGAVGEAVHNITRQQGDVAPVVHQNVICDMCGKHPIVGIRFKCAECADFDVCETCEEQMEDEEMQQKLKEMSHAHHPKHTLLKMRVPVTRAWAREFRRNFEARGSAAPNTPPTPMHAYARGSYDDAGRYYDDESRWERRHRRHRRRFGGRRGYWDGPHGPPMRPHFPGPMPMPHGGPPMPPPPHFMGPMPMPHGGPPMPPPPHFRGPMPHGGPPMPSIPRMHTMPVNMPPPGLPPRQPSHSVPQWWRNKSTPSTAAGAATGTAGRPREVGRPRADFVRDVSMPDRSVCRPGTQMVKTWQFINAGSIPWPQDTMLVHVQGDLLHDANLEFPVSACQPGQKCDVSVVIRTPEIPGRFVSYYRLKEPLVMGGKLFGEKVWVDFFVEIVEEEDEESEKAIVDQALVEAIEKSKIEENSNENSNEVNDNAAEDDAAASMPPPPLADVLESDCELEIEEDVAAPCPPLRTVEDDEQSIDLSVAEQVLHFRDEMPQMRATATAAATEDAKVREQEDDEEEEDAGAASMPPLTMVDSVMSLNSWNSPHRDEVKSDVMEEEIVPTMSAILEQPSAPPAAVTASATAAADTTKKPKTARQLEDAGVAMLVGMGFANEQLNRFMLQKYNNDVQKVVDWLLAHV